MLVDLLSFQQITTNNVYSFSSIANLYSHAYKNSSKTNGVHVSQGWG